MWKARKLNKRRVETYYESFSSAIKVTYLPFDSDHAPSPGWCAVALQTILMGPESAETPQVLQAVPKNE